MNILPQLIALGLWPKKEAPPVSGGFRGAAGQVTVEKTWSAFPWLMVFDAEVFDTENAFDPATGIFTVPEGVSIMRVGAYWQAPSSINTAASMVISVQDSDAQVDIAGTRTVVSRVAGYPLSITYASSIFDVTPGQRLVIRLSSNGASYTKAEVGTNAYFEIIK